ncbi:MAG: carboxypeptidase regulatory-like domain-containing protein [Acidobacteria bacterium]|nr:carboxypeptidase regulatory-like domain-containing protein [Acidobacteriota bacterium]
MFGRIFTRSLALTLVLLATAILNFGQDLDDITITGKVLDANGLAIVGATVTATMTETKESRNVVTDGEGRYLLVKLKPGTYKIKVAASGFGTQETPEIATVLIHHLPHSSRVISPSLVVQHIRTTLRSTVSTTMTTVPHVTAFSRRSRRSPRFRSLLISFRLNTAGHLVAVSTYEHVPVETSFADEPSCSFETKA